jgi:hypothetical protein
MRVSYFLMVTAMLEAGVGLLLLVLPAIPVELLLGVSPEDQTAITIGRVAGATLLALGVACWLARHDTQSPSLRGLLTGLLFYNGTVTAILGYSALGLHMTGIILWPTVTLHTLLGGWCMACLGDRSRGRN